MRRRTRIALLGACTVWLAAPAGAADQAIGAVKLTLSRSASGREKLVFVSKDPAFLFPPLGSADDPGTGSPGGALLEVASFAEPAGAALAVPPASASRAGGRRTPRPTSTSTPTPMRRSARRR